ncbi:hypothetical protein DL89DRAFT_169340 [Linderina pennispora]|uniref:Uncharacterized protein n=1 Tax=Linderina pennispora TaxID=61395 RepID=A0A1Y1W656_9FUNG|nr:uncharacterized protein DL89DRAFT_169340 [Linderina pennispora]ORX69009.1 hypothetical protein DL89DRAFT_169340 [Linderina pennispora]
MLKLGLVSAILVAVALHAHAQETATGSTLDAASEEDQSLFSIIKYPIGILAGAQYKLDFEVVKTKSDAGPARYNVNVSGKCEQFIPEPRTFTYTHFDGYNADSYSMESGDNSNQGELGVRSWVTHTHTTSYRDLRMKCNGAYLAAYNDSNDQYTKSAEYSSRSAHELVNQGLTAFEDNPNPTSHSWYSSGYRSKVSSATDYSTSDPTPTGNESRESVLETLAPPHNTDERVTSGDEETEAASTSSIVWTTLHYPFGVMANADYRLSIELVKTKSDVGPARYNIDMRGTCPESTPGPYTFVGEDFLPCYPHPGCLATMSSGENENRPKYSWILYTTTATPDYVDFACGGVYEAVYSDSVTQYTKTVEFVSQIPFRVAQLAYTAFEDNPRPEYYLPYEDDDDAGSSEEELDTVELMPASADATSLVPETPTPTPHINELHIEL